MVDKILRVSRPFRLGFCACGCGEEIKLRTKNGTLRRFVNGHNSRGEISPHYKGGIFEVDGYLYIRKPDHPYATTVGYVALHRWIKEQELGRVLDPKESVHHKNRDSLDNRPENLELFENFSAHRKQHVKDNRENNISKRKCAMCGGDTRLKVCHGKRTRLDGTVYKFIYTRYDWNRNPLDKDQWLCGNCYKKVLRRTGRMKS